MSAKYRDFHGLIFGGCYSALALFAVLVFITIFFWIRGLGC